MKYCKCDNWKKWSGFRENERKMNFCPYCGKELREENDTEKVVPGFEDVTKFATDKNGIVDLSKMQELEGRYSHLPGRSRH